MILILFVFFFAYVRSPWATAKPTDAFVELTKQPYYIDKTDLLHVVSEFASNYDFIACPSRFMKTSHLHMIKSFYQLEFDADGRVKNYSETETLAFFKNFKIANHSANFLHNRMAHHPVVLIDLKFNVSEVKTIAQVDALLNTRLREAFDEYFNVLPKQPKPNGDFEVTKFEQEFVQKLQNGSANQFELSYGLYRLSNVLFKYFKRRVIILIDNYDYAANEAVVKYPALLDTDGTVDYFYTTVNNMFRKTFKENRKFKNYAMMTGISGPIEYAESEVQENRFLDGHRFSKYFGFSEADVDEVCTRYNISFFEVVDVRAYYGSYFVRLHNHCVYNPYSIIQHVTNTRQLKPDEKRKFEPYWGRAENHEFIKQACKSESFMRKLRNIVNDQSPVNISACCRSSPVLDTFVRTITEKRERATFKGIHQLNEPYLFQYLFETGYLTYVQHFVSESLNVFNLPNLEIKDTLKQILKNIL